MRHTTQILYLSHIKIFHTFETTTWIQYVHFLFVSRCLHRRRRRCLIYLLRKSVIKTSDLQPVTQLSSGLLPMCVDNTRALAHIVSTWILYWLFSRFDGEDPFECEIYKSSAEKLPFAQPDSNEKSSAFKIHAAPFTKSMSATILNAVVRCVDSRCYRISWQEIQVCNLVFLFRVCWNTYFILGREMRNFVVHRKKYNVQSCVAISIFYQNVKLLQTAWKCVITGIYILLNVFNALRSLEAIYFSKLAFTFTCIHITPIFCK